MPFRSASSELPPSAGPMYAWSSRWHFWQTPGPLLLAERRAGAVGEALADERVVLRARHDLHGPVHQRVLDAAELGAAGDVAFRSAP